MAQYVHTPRTTRRKITVGPLTIGFIGQLILAAIALSMCCSCLTISIWGDRVTARTVSGTVDGTYIKRYGEADYFHVVVIKDDGTTEIFQNRDSIGWLKFDSADLQAKLQKGSHYTFRVCGFRFKPLSMFRNIIIATPAAAP